MARQELLPGEKPCDAQSYILRRRADRAYASCEAWIDLTQFPVLLEIEPQSRGGAERPGEHDRHLSRHAPAATANLIDPRDVRVEVSRQAHLRDAALVQHLLKDVTGVDGNGEVYEHSAILQPKRL